MSETERVAALSERAAAAARAELRGERDSILGAIAIASPAPLARAREVPERLDLSVRDGANGGGLSHPLALAAADPAEGLPSIRCRSICTIKPTSIRSSKAPSSSAWRAPATAFASFLLPRRSAEWKRRCIGPRPFSLALSFITSPARSIWALCGVRCRCRQGAEANQADPAHLQRAQAAWLAHHRARAHPPPGAAAVMPSLRGAKRRNNPGRPLRKPWIASLALAMTEGE